MGIKLNFHDFFFSKKLFLFSVNRENRGKNGKNKGKIQTNLKKSQKIPKNSKKSQKIIGVEIFYFGTSGGARVVPGCYFWKVFGKIHS